MFLIIKHILSPSFEVLISPLKDKQPFIFQYSYKQTSSHHQVLKCVILC